MSTARGKRGGDGGEGPKSKSRKQENPLGGNGNSVLSPANPFPLPPLPVIKGVDDDINSPSATAHQKHPWTDDAIQLFLNLRFNAENIEAVRRETDRSYECVTLQSRTWQRIHQQMSEAGYSYVLQRLKDKWGNLLRRYKQTRLQLQRAGYGADPLRPINQEESFDVTKHWRWFPIMEENLFLRKDVQGALPSAASKKEDINDEEGDENDPNRESLEGQDNNINLEENTMVKHHPPVHSYASSSSSHSPADRAMENIIATLREMHRESILAQEKYGKEIINQLKNANISLSAIAASVKK